MIRTKALVATLAAAGLTVATGALAGPSAISARPWINDGPINANTTAWFNSIVKASGVPRTQPVTLCVTQQVLTIRNGARDVQTYLVPDAMIQYKPWESAFGTSWDGNDWTISAPTTPLRDTFSSGVALPMLNGLPSTAVVTWSGVFESDTAGISVQWAWSVAPYTLFTDQYNQLEVDPIGLAGVHLAGTPVAYKQYAVNSGSFAYTGTRTATMAATAEQSGNCHGLY